MANSPQIVTFFLFTATNAPATGLTPTFTTYKDETGANLSQPAIHEIGGGAYYFTPAFTAGHGIAYVIATGAINPPVVSGYVRPEDFYPDEIDLIRKLQTNKWSIVTTGVDANKMVFYDDDGTTPILKVALTDATGAGTFVNPFTRTPTT